MTWKDWSRCEVMMAWTYVITVEVGEANRV